MRVIEKCAKFFRCDIFSWLTELIVALDKYKLVIGTIVGGLWSC